MLNFLDWLTCTTHGLTEGLNRLLGEGDQGYRAFIDQTNREFRRMIAELLRTGKFSDPRNEAEARIIVSDPHYFNYAGELLAAANGGRAGLRGQDVLDGAQEAAVQLWMKLLNPALYVADGVTWESKNPLSVERNGIRGTVRSWARNVAGHFAARLHKRRTAVTTSQFGQMRHPDRSFDPPARPETSELEWEDLKRSIVADLEDQLRREEQNQGPHWQSRAKKFHLAVEIVKRQMAIPWTWRSMPEVAAEMPELNGKLRGGLADQLKVLIDKARRKALGESHLRAAHFLALNDHRLAETA